MNMVPGRAPRHRIKPFHVQMDVELHERCKHCGHVIAGISSPHAHEICVSCERCWRRQYVLFISLQKRQKGNL